MSGFVKNSQGVIDEDEAIESKNNYEDEYENEDFHYVYNDYFDENDTNEEKAEEEKKKKRSRKK